MKRTVTAVLVTGFESDLGASDPDSTADTDLKATVIFLQRAIAE